MKIAVLDIGGTSIKSGIYENNKLSEMKEWNTNAGFGGQYLMERAKMILKSFKSFDAVGISTAGQVDISNGTIFYANENIPNYTGIKIRKIMSEEFNVLVAVENDVNAAAIGEMHYGAAVGLKNFLCVTYGTGVGGAIVADGNIYSGYTWSGGGFGGIVTHPEDMNPGVEFSGCYEKYASTSCLVKRVHKIDDSLNTGRKVFEAFERTEIKSEIDCWINEIVIGLVTLIHIFNPEKIVLGGGVMSQPYVIKEVKMRTKALISPGFRATEIVPAMLGNQAGLMGAAWLAEREFVND